MQFINLICNSENSKVTKQLYLCTESSLALHNLNDVGAVWHDVAHHKVTLRLQPWLPNFSHFHIHLCTRFHKHPISTTFKFSIYYDHFLLINRLIYNVNIFQTNADIYVRRTGFSPRFRSFFLPKSAAYTIEDIVHNYKD